MGTFDMRASRLEVWLATTALALALGGISPAAYAMTQDEMIAAAVPMPESADVPPPSVNDFAGPAAVDRPAVAPPARAAKPDTPTTPAAAAPAPTAEPTLLPMAERALGTVDQQVADRIHELLAGKADRIIDRRYKGAVEAFYAARANAPLWSEQGLESARA
jgi:L,D-transpeptidase YcbB